MDEVLRRRLIGAAVLLALGMVLGLAVAMAGFLAPGGSWPRLPANAVATAGISVRQRGWTRRANCQVAQAVPHTAPPLFVPSSVAGVAPG